MATNKRNRNTYDAIRSKYSKSKIPPGPTAADDNIKKVVDALNKVDPGRLSQVFKNFHTEVNKVTNLLSFGLSSGSGSSTPKPTNSIKLILSDALTGALSILIKQYDYKTIIDVLLPSVEHADFLLIDEDYQEIVKTALINLYTTVYMYGEENLPTSILPEIVFGDETPSPVYEYDQVPELYVKQYYSIENDPYPGYIQWKNENDEILYTIRGATDYPFESSEEELYSLAEIGLAAALKVYIEFYLENETISLTTALLLALLIQFCLQIDEKASESSVGKGGNNFAGSLTQILGPVLGSMTQTSLTNHVPQSVLKQGEINNLINKMKKMQGKINMVIEPSLKKAIQNVPGNISDITGMLSLGVSNVDAIIGNLTNLQNLSGNPNISNFKPVIDSNLLQKNLNLINSNIDSNDSMKTISKILRDVT